MRPVELSPEQQGRIWEVYARLGLRPEQAVHLLRRMGVCVTPKLASQEMALARRRNTLCLVSAASLVTQNLDVAQQPPARLLPRRAGPHPWSLAPGVTRRLFDKFMISRKSSMKPSTALKVLRAFLLFAFLLLAGFVIFCLALSAQAAPAKNAVHAASKALPAVRQKPPVVRIGRPYCAELRSVVKPQSFSPQFLKNEDANAQYLAWRNSIQFDRLRAK